MVIFQKIPFYLKSPAFIAAAFLSILFYTHTIFPKPQKFSSLILEKNIKILEGEIVSNPVKITTFGKPVYRAVFCPQKVSDGKTISSSAKGECFIFLPAEKIESRFPNGLWTAANESKGVLAEEGARLKLFVKPQENGVFFAEKVFPAENGLWARGIFGKIAHFRAECRLKFRFLLLTWGEPSSLILALFAAERSALDYRLSRDFTNAGLSHVLALSGMHLSLLGTLSFRAFRRLFGKKIALIFRIFVVFAFVWFAGISPSLVRALFCLLIFSVCDFLSIKKPHFLSVLSLSFLIHCAIFPKQIFSAAFMLSYASLFGILILSPLLKFILIRFLPYKITDALSVSVSAFFVTAPISLFLFGKIYPIGIFASPVVSPLVEFFMKISLFFIFLSIVAPFLSPAFGVIIETIYNILKRTVAFFASI